MPSTRIHVFILLRSVSAPAGRYGLNHRIMTGREEVRKRVPLLPRTIDYPVDSRYENIVCCTLEKVTAVTALVWVVAESNRCLLTH